MFKFVEKFSIGDGIIIDGKCGTVVDSMTKLIERRFCTARGVYVQVAFNNSTEMKWVGGDVGRFKFEYYQKDRKVKKFASLFSR